MSQGKHLYFHIVGMRVLRTNWVHFTPGTMSEQHFLSRSLLRLKNNKGEEKKPQNKVPALSDLR